MTSIHIRRLILLLALTPLLCYHPRIASSVTDVQTNISVKSITQPDLGEAPMAIQKDTVFELNFFAITRASIVIHRLNERGSELAATVFEETFVSDPRAGAETTRVTATKEINLPERAQYRLAETYILEAAPDTPFLPPNPFFKISWTRNFDIPILDAGRYNFSLDAFWHDIRVIAAGDLIGEVLAGGEVPPKIEKTKITVAVQIPAGELIETTVTFDGKLSKTTGLSAVATISKPQASPEKVKTGVGEANTLLTIQLNGDITPAAVKVDLSPLGLDSQSPMYDDATHGDAVSDDNIHSLFVTISDSVSPGSKNLPVTVSDDKGNNYLTSISLEVIREINPEIIALKPDRANIGVNGLDISVTGANFVIDTTVSFSNPGIIVNWSAVDSPTRMTANISISNLTSIGPCDVTLNTPTGGNVTKIAAFTVLPHSVTASGVVLFEGRENQSELVALSLRQEGSLEALETQDVQTDSDGNFSVSFSVPSGEYDLTAKANGFLQSIARNVTLPATEVEFVPSPLLGGDSNNDNRITLVDFALLAYSFNTTIDDELFNPNCDYNKDGAVTIKDFQVLAKNFSVLGISAPALVGIREYSYGRPHGLHPPIRLKIPLIPLTTQLAQNYPNPFNPDTWIPFALSNDSDVTISIYDVTGRLVRELKPGRLAAGSYLDKSKAVHWDGKDKFNERVSSGVYLYHLQARNFSAMRKMMILK